MNLGDSPGQSLEEAKAARGREGKVEGTLSRARMSLQRAGRPWPDWTSPFPHSSLWVQQTAGRNSKPRDLVSVSRSLTSSDSEMDGTGRPFRAHNWVRVRAPWTGSGPASVGIALPAPGRWEKTALIHVFSISLRSPGQSSPLLGGLLRLTPTWPHSQMSPPHPRHPRIQGGRKASS